MRPCVRAALLPFTTRFEGRVRNMYLDVLGLVTTAVGNLIDPMSLALPLPWVHKLDGTPAAKSEIVGEWSLVKSAQALRRLGGGHFAQLTKLCLTDDAIDALVSRRFDEIEKQLLGAYPTWEFLPAPVQLAALSMSWAMGAARIVPGPSFEYPRFRDAVLAGDWGCAAEQCYIQDHDNPGLVPRNAANKALFLAAAAGGDPDTLPTI